MRNEIFNSTWSEYVKFKFDSENEIKSIWFKILERMPEEIRSKVPEDPPTLETYAKKESISSSIPYVFRIPNICNCNGINQFLENFVIYIHWK